MQHESFADYKYRLISLSAEHSVVQGNIKFAKTTIKRAIAEIISSPTLAHPTWLYHFYFTLSSIATNESDYPFTLLNLREAENLAERRGDIDMYWAIKVFIARLALGEREFELAATLIDQIAEMMGFAKINESDGGSKVKLEEAGVDQGYLCKQLRIHFIVIYCLYHAQYGKVKIAKDTLKIAHGFLDETTTTDGDVDGWVKVSHIGPMHESKLTIVVARFQSVLENTATFSRPRLRIISPNYRLDTLSPRQQQR